MISRVGDGFRLLESVDMMPEIRREKLASDGGGRVLESHDFKGMSSSDFPFVNVFDEIFVSVLAPTGVVPYRAHSTSYVASLNSFAIFDAASANLAFAGGVPSVHLSL